ncbi:MAG: sigma-70 family RNA polymerase sigma factor [Gemmataceae bacterium]
MCEEPKKYDLDLARMTDEALVVLAQECAFRPATDVLVMRHYEPMNKLIARKAKFILLAADVQDAQQDGVFAILNAIAGYNTLEAAKARGCSFRSYLHMVVTCRFLDYVRHLHRVEKRYRRLEETEDRLSDGGGQRSTGRWSDPVEALARQEETARLHRALDRLDDTMRGLWQELTTGKKLPQIAREQGLSYNRVKRQRQRLLAQLAAALGEGRDG